MTRVSRALSLASMQKTSRAMSPLAHNRDVMVGYQRVLRKTKKSEGWLAQRWRPIFALFTLCFVMIAVTVCRGIWIGQLAGPEAVTGLLITMLTVVLGVQIWQRSEEKKAGVLLQPIPPFRHRSWPCVSRPSHTHKDLFP
jgi:hypothetical protein